MKEEQQDKKRNLRTGTSNNDSGERREIIWKKKGNTYKGWKTKRKRRMRGTQKKDDNKHTSEKL